MDDKGLGVIEIMLIAVIAVAVLAFVLRCMT